MSGTQRDFFWNVLKWKKQKWALNNRFFLKVCCVFLKLNNIICFLQILICLCELCFSTFFFLNGTTEQFMKINKSFSGGQLRVAQTATPKLLGPKSNNSPLKNDGWKTILSFSGPGLFSGAKCLNFQSRGESISQIFWLAFICFYLYVTIWKVDGTTPPKGGFLRSHDKPIHGSCAIYFPGRWYMFFLNVTIWLHGIWVYLNIFQVGWLNLCVKMID